MFLGQNVVKNLAASNHMSWVSFFCCNFYKSQEYYYLSSINQRFPFLTIVQYKYLL